MFNSWESYELVPEDLSLTAPWSGFRMAEPGNAYVNLADRALTMKISFSPADK